MSKLGRGASGPESYCTQLPLWTSERCECVNEDVYFLLPYEVLDYKIVDDNADNWTTPQHDQMGRTVQEWCDNVNIDANAGPPMAGLGLWGDSAKLWTKSGVVLLLFNVLTSVNNDRFPIVALSKKHLCACGCSGRHTFERLFEVIGWALNVHASGKNPTHRDDGAPFQW